MLENRIKDETHHSFLSSMSITDDKPFQKCWMEWNFLQWCCEKWIFPMHVFMQRLMNRNKNLVWNEFRTPDTKNVLIHRAKLLTMCTLRNGLQKSFHMQHFVEWGCSTRLHSQLTHIYLVIKTSHFANCCTYNYFLFYMY